MDEHEYQDISSHYVVGRYTIDIVVNIADGTRLAIECDGDQGTLSQTEIQQAIDQQHVLERLGWNVLRINIAEFYTDTLKAKSPILSSLTELSKKQQLLSSLASKHDYAVIRTTFSQDEASELQKEDTSNHATNKRSASDFSETLNQGTDSTSVSNDEAPEIQNNNTQSEKVKTENAQSYKNSQLMKLALLKIKVQPVGYGLSTNRIISTPIIPFPEPWLGVRKWAKSASIFLIANEYPLQKELLMHQLNERLKAKCIFSHSFKQYVNESLNELTAEQCIYIDKNDYIYPCDTSIPFSITLGRELTYIGSAEMEAAICTVLSSQDFWETSKLENELATLYHIREFEKDDFHALCMNSFKQLIDTDKVLMIGKTVMLDKTKIDVLTPSNKYFAEYLYQLK